MAALRIKRGTRAQLNAAASASQLLAAEPYLITDELKFAVGLSPSAYQVIDLAPPVRAGIDVTIAVSQIAFGSQVLAANTIRTFPWLVTSPLTLGQLRIEVATLGAGSSFRLGLYNDSGQAYPNILINNSDVGALDGSTTGIKLGTFASNITLNPGLYWLAVNCNAACTPRAIPVSGILNCLGINPAGGTTTYTGWSVAQTFGAMPSTFPTASAVNTSVLAPAAMFRTV